MTANSTERPPVAPPNQHPSTGGSEQTASGLRAVLTPDGATFVSSVEGRVTAEIRNEGTQPGSLRMDILEVGILSLDVFDGDGERIPTIPPPMPLTPEQIETAREELAPGQSRKVTYSLHMFSPQLPPGTYTVQLHDIPCEAIRFTIGPPP